MTKQLLELTIAKVGGAVFDGAVESVTVPGADGEMTLLAHHEALISPLKAGTITVQTPSDKKIFDIESGTLEISDNRAIVLL